MRHKQTAGWKWLALWAFVCLNLLGIVARANTCGPATTQGTAPADYKTYCWLDFTGYNDTTAKSAAGQNFSFTLPDTSTMTLNLKISSSVGGTALTAKTSPSWTGAAFGNSAFIGIPGNPVLYTAQNGSTVTVTLRNISITPPSGIMASTSYAIIAADGESTNNGETLTFTTNGSPWQQLVQVPNGPAYPTVSGVGTNTVTETGVAGTVGSYIFGSFNNPTTVSSVLKAGGLQGAIFAVRFASVGVTVKLPNGRVNSADQFTYGMKATTGTVIASQTSSGTGNGPFPEASVATLAASYPFIVNETMAAGSVSTLNNYATSLTCINNGIGSGTPVPSNLNATSYTFSGVQYGDAIVCTFSNTAYASIAGTVYNDANHNTAMDSGETGTGVTPLYVKLAPVSGGVCQSPATLAASVVAATGAYNFPGIAPGNYCLILSTNNTLSTITPSTPAGWVGTEAASGVRQVTVSMTPPAPQNFGLFKGSSLSGTVFADTGVGSGGNANNGVQDGSEVGLAGVTVNAVASSTTVASAITNGSGAYTLWIPSTVSSSTVITPVNPSGYLATGGSAGTSGGSYNRPNVTFTPAAGANVTAVNFGLVPPNALAPDGAQNAAPGAVVFYPHTFTAASGGQVTFSTSALASPAWAGWNESLYQDPTCSGQMAAGNPLITAPVVVTAGQTVCVLVREFVPANAPQNAQNKVTLSTAFSYTGASPALNATLTRVDVTTVGVGDLQLSKLVSNITQGGGNSTSNNAVPGDTLQYQLTLKNAGSAAAGNVVVNDATPAFTAYVSTACPAPASLPPSLTGCTITQQPAVGGQGAVSWSFTGTLQSGASLVLTYRVKVSP